MDKKNRIVVMEVINSFSLAGAENLVFNIAKKMDKSIFDVFVCGIVKKDDSIEKSIIEDLSVNGVKTLVPDRSKNKKRLYAFFQLTKLIRKNEIDIIHAHCSSPDFYGSIASLLSGRRLIFSTIHNTNGYPILRERLLSHIIERFVAISKEVEKYAINVLKIPSEKVKIIYNGIDIEKFRKVKVNKKMKLTELGISKENCKIVTTVGRVTKQKGQIYFVRAAKLILKQFPNTYFLIVGDYSNDADYAQKVKRIAYDMGIENKIIFTGVRQDIPEVLKISDVFVLPSLWEGFVTVILEAMASGLPVVATDVGSIREVIKNEVNGMIIPPKNDLSIATSVIKLLGNEEYAERIAINGQESVKSFSIENTVQLYEQLYLTSYEKYMQKQNCSGGTQNRK